MSGTFRRLRPGRYHLLVEKGEGPAGIRRSTGGDIVIGIEGGTRDFSVRQQERVYYWWRGPAPRPGVRLEAAAAAKPPVPAHFIPARAG